ncbi:MAG: response regulator [Anaerolineae bacterium]
MAKIRVLVVDDYKLVRLGIRAFLESSDDIAVVAEAANGEQALELVETCAPDVTVLDIKMPVMGGIDAARAIRSLSPRTRILILTAFEEKGHINTLFDLGVKAYLLKTCGIGELQDAVRAVVRGETFIQPGLVFAGN